MKIIKIETQFLIAVILVLMSGTTVTGLLMEKLDDNLDRGHSQLKNMLDSQVNAKHLYERYLQCLDNSCGKICFQVFSMELDGIEGIDKPFLLRMAILAKQPNYSGYPKITLATLGFSVAVLYCVFILLQLKKS